MTTKHAQLGDRNSARAKRAPAKRNAGGRWSVECRNGWDLVSAFDGADVSIYDVVKLLNRARVTLPKRKGTR